MVIRHSLICWLWFCSILLFFEWTFLSENNVVSKIVQSSRLMNLVENWVFEILNSRISNYNLVILFSKLKLKKQILESVKNFSHQWQYSRNGGWIWSSRPESWFFSWFSFLLNVGRNKRKKFINNYLWNSLIHLFFFSFFFFNYLSIVIDWHKNIVYHRRIFMHLSHPVFVPFYRQ